MSEELSAFALDYLFKGIYVLQPCNLCIPSEQKQTCLLPSVIKIVFLWTNRQACSVPIEKDSGHIPFQNIIYHGYRYRLALFPALELSLVRTSKILISRLSSY